MACALAYGSSGFFLLRSTNSPKQSSLRYPLAANLRAEGMATEKLGIKVENNPPESKLSQLGIRQWPKYVKTFSIFFSYFLLLFCSDGFLFLYKCSEIDEI